ncbi:MAG: ABC transporter permease [bacterium]|nr:ABC transporter permease [bacterium]
MNIFVFGWGFGCLTAYLIFRFGTKVQIFAWSLIALLFPISGVFYPISTLPDFLALVARFVPVSYIFEGLRSIVITGQAPDPGDFSKIILLNLVYLTLGIWLFVRGFKSAKARGWFIHPS